MTVLAHVALSVAFWAFMLMVIVDSHASGMHRDERLARRALGWACVAAMAFYAEVWL